RIFITAPSDQAGIKLSGGASVLSHVEIDMSAGGGQKQAALVVDAAAATDIVAISTAPEGRGCEVIHNSTLTDALCEATLANGKGVATYIGVGPGTTNNSVLKNVTAIAAGTGGIGIDALSANMAGQDQNIFVTNTIARGQPGHADVQAAQGPGAMSTATITIDHSNFGFESTIPIPGDHVIDA